MVAACFLAAGVFDEPLYSEAGEAAFHCGFRIGRVRDDFRGPAAGMLLDVAEHRVKLVLGRDGREPFAFPFFAVRLFDIRIFQIRTQVLVNDGC